MTRDGHELDDATIDRLGEEVAEAGVATDRAIHELLTRIRRFDEAGGWHRLGARTMAHWLSFRLGTGPGAARELTRVAQALASLPRIDAALQRGELSYCKVRAITRVASGENEEVLLEYARQLTGAQLEKLCSRFRGVLGHASVEAPPSALPDRYVRHYPTDDGMVRIVLQLHPDEAARVLEAIDAARRLHAVSEPTGAPGGDVSAETSGGEGEVSPAPGHVSAETPGAEAAVAPAPGHVSAETPGAEAAVAPALGHVSAETPRGEGEVSPALGDVSAETTGAEAAVAPGGGAPPPPAPSATSGREARGWPRAADGAVLLAEGFLANARLGAPGSPRFEVTVLVDEATLAGRAENPAALGDDLGVSAETARRLACDAALVPAAVGPQGEVLGVGRRTRTIPVPLLRALRLRDGCCRFPGCTNRHYVDGHHVKHWAQGGETKLTNLVTLCGFHHRLVHEGGFGCTMEGDRFVFSRPDGERLDEVALRPWERQDVSAETRPLVSPSVRATWDGWPLDYGLAIEALLPRVCRMRRRVPSAA